MQDLLKIPRWGILSLIMLTVALSFVILIKIWFPNLLPEDLFEKIFWTYVVLIVSSALISRMADYLKNMQSEPENEQKK